MLERILHFSINHRWLVILLVLSAAGAGAYALKDLPIDAVPDITGKGVVITTSSPALSPIEIEKRVTLVLESTLSGIPSLRYTSSLSRNGLSQITCYFEDDVDIYFARTQVSERLREAKEALPPGVEPKMGPVSTGLGEVYMWTVEFAHPDGKGAEVPPSADGRRQPGWQKDGTYLTPDGDVLADDAQRLTYLRTVQDWIVRPQVRAVKDIADVDVQGGFVKQYVVEPDPQAMISRGLTYRDLVDALEKNHVSTGAGYIEQNGEAFLVRAIGQLTNTEDVGRVIVAQREGTPVRVRDIARVVSGHEQPTGGATRDGRDAVLGIAQMLTGANSRTAAAGVEAKINELRKLLPPDVHATPLINRMKLVDSTIATVRKNLVEGAILVVIVLFLLLGNVRAALIASLAIPISMLMTASGMVAGKISGNLMSLGAIDFGLIVDGSVIIVENCLRMLAHRQQELGRPLTTPERLGVVFEASKQVRSATAFGEVIIILVYLPILALGGVEGRMFHPMALTVILALCAAFVLSLTFVPAMVAILVRGRLSERENPLIRTAKTVYEPMVRGAIHLRWTIVPLAFGAFAASLLLFGKLGQTFVPTLDEGDLLTLNKRVASMSLAESVRFTKVYESALMARDAAGKPFIPELESVATKVGTGDMASDPLPMSQAESFLILKPRSQWPDPAKPKEEVRKAVARVLEGMPATAPEFSQPIEDRFNEVIAGVKQDLAVRVYGDDFETMIPLAKQVKKILEGVRGHASVEMLVTDVAPVMTFNLDADAAGRHGLTRTDIADVITAAIGGRETGIIYEGDRRFSLVIRLPETLRQNLEALRRLPVPMPRKDGVDALPAKYTTAGAVLAGGSRPAALPLETFAKIEIIEGPTEIQRQNGHRHVQVTCNVQGRDLGSFVAEAQALVDQQVELPKGKGYRIEWGGQFENLLAARHRLQFVVPACFFLIFVLLFTTFNSVRDALIVFSGVPLALTGGIVALWLRGIDFSISAGVGFIALSGVAVLNGLVMVTFIKQLRNEGMPLEEAIIKGSLTRLRPVLMTALVASLGFVPMALATGPGAEVQKPLATVVIGGVISSTLLTLVVLPALYRMGHRIKGTPRRVHPVPEEALPVA